MRILFASGVDVGGAPSSTLELARRLSARGHDVGLLLGSARQEGRIYNTLYKAAIKTREAMGWSWPRELLRGFGRGGGLPADDQGVRIWRRSNAANALRPVLNIFRPDVVVANSLPREHLRWMLEDAHRAGVRLALYMREAHSVTHLAQSKLRLDAVLANSLYLASQAERAGYECIFVPSLVDLTAAEVKSSRDTAVLINPVPENRPGIMRDLAASRSDIRVVLQESWPLDKPWRDELASWTASLPNLTFRKRQELPRDIYRDARLVVATYPSGRPRVVLESQHNAIPVIAHAQPALVEAVGDGGVLVPTNASDHEWVAAISQTWDDVDGYGAMCERALKHSQREEIRPDAITRRFEEALQLG